MELLNYALETAAIVGCGVAALVAKYWRDMARDAEDRRSIALEALQAEQKDNGVLRSEKWAAQSRANEAERCLDLSRAKVAQLRKASAKAKRDAAKGGAKR